MRENAEAARGESRESINKEEEMVEGNEGKNICETADKRLSDAKKASILKQIGAFALRLGAGAAALAKRLSGVKSTEEAMREIDEQVAENRARREPASRRYDELYRLIVGKKKLYQAAPGARRKILEMELKGAIAEYQSLERQIAAYLSNEVVLTKVKGRMCELVAAGLRNVSEGQIDKLADKIDDAAEEADGIEGAIADLDKAGERREREDGSFEDVLAAFGDELPEDDQHETAESAASSTEDAVPSAPLGDI